MSFFPRTRLCHSPEPIVTLPMDKKAAIWDSSASSSTAMAMPMLATAADDPELHYPFYHQRGRRRRRSPPPVPLSLAMTTPQQMHRPYHPPRTRHNLRPRQQTPSGSSSTFRGRRRHRSPSVGATAAIAAAAAATAIRKASSRSSRPHTRSSSVASSIQHVSRPSSPHEWRGATTTSNWRCRSVSRSRGRQGRRGGTAGAATAKRGVESPSPRRKMAYRTSMEMDRSMMMHYHNTHHHLLEPRPYTKPVSRRSHCPSRSGSAEGYHEDAGGPSASSTTDPITMAARRRRRRQRTQSRPRPQRVISGDSVGGGGGSSGLYEVAGYYTFDNDALMAHTDSVDKPGDVATASSRLQFQMLLAESSDTTSDGDAMDVEMG